MELGEHKRRKVIEPDFFGKYLFGQKMGKKVQKRAKIGYLDAWLRFLGMGLTVNNLGCIHQMQTKLYICGSTV